LGDDLKNLVPTCIIYMNGTRISGNQEASVKQVIINERVDTPSTCAVVLSDTSREWTDCEDFAEGSEIKISLGYKDNIEEVFAGDVVGINPQYRQNSDDLLIVKGKNALHRLVRAKKIFSFSEMTDTDIVKQIAGDAGLGDDIDDIGVQHVFTMQRNLTDYEYVGQIARKYNCKLYIKDNTLYMKHAADAEAGDVVLEWGKSLLEFNVTSDTTNIVTEVEVRGWDNEKGEAIVGTAAIADVRKPFDGDTIGGTIVNDNFGAAKMILIDENVIDQDSADALALEVLTGNSMNYITGTAKTEGNNKLKVGTIVELKELGTRFSGKYFVNSIEHVFNAGSGYVTYFNVSRNTA